MHMHIKRFKETMSKQVGSGMNNRNHIRIRAQIGAKADLFYLCGIQFDIHFNFL